MVLFTAKIETINRSVTRVIFRLKSLVLLGILSKNRGAKKEKKKSAVFEKWGSQFWRQNT